MLKALSTYVFVKQRLHPGHLEAAQRSGAQAVEIFCARPHFDYTERSQISEIANWFKSSNLTVNSLHAPMHSDDWGKTAPPLNVVDRDKRRRIESLDEIKRALEVAERLPFRFLVQHIGNSGEEYDERHFDYALTAVEHLRAFAKPLGVSILVENIPNSLSTPEKLAELIKVSHFTDVGVCFDFGHAHIMNTIRKDFDVLRPLVRSTHVHDNNRMKDEHLWPGDGNIDWAEAMDLLRSAPQTPPLLFEIDGGEEPIAADIQQNAAQAFTRLENKAVSA
jgi:sugar phosphate isomerase/epimerase